MNPLLAQLRESHNFQVIMDEMRKSRPVVPGYTPQKTIDDTANLIEQIKYRSAQKDGFDLLYTLLTGTQP